jgi:hypothetical protein
MFKVLRLDFGTVLTVVYFIFYVVKYILLNA